MKKIYKVTFSNAAENIDLPEGWDIESVLHSDSYGVVLVLKSLPAEPVYAPGSYGYELQRQTLGSPSSYGTISNSSSPNPTYTVAGAVTDSPTFAEVRMNYTAPAYSSNR